jgi:Na+-transporting NADH:ubiquinone oxidoreductase subunit B
MKPIKKIFDGSRHYFEAGGKFASLRPLFDATETFFFFPGSLTQKGAHVRDSLDVKRYMSIVLLALMPPFLFGIYNAGYQANLASGVSAGFVVDIVQGLRIVVPLLLVSYIVGFFWETVFASIRKHPISEGLLVTGLLFPMTLPPTIPLWQAAVGISFGIVIGKEIFGGTGRNLLNPALTARAFIFFAYPGSMSGETVWTYMEKGAGQTLDAISAATALAMAAAGDSIQGVDAALTEAGYSMSSLFWGLHPGCIGETSTVLCLLGATILIVTGIGSYRIIIGGLVGFFSLALAGYFGAAFLDSPPVLLGVNPLAQFMMGGFALGIVYMATDPVSAPGTNAARWIYGVAIGALTVLIRVFNPAYPEGVMLAILFMNLFSPLLDYFVIKSKVRKRVPNVW